MKNIIKLLRPHQYIKNIFLNSPLLFSFKFNISNFIETLYAFILFSIIASSIYIFNDYMDIEEDKKHPTKKYRPLASGKLSKNTAKFLFFTLSIIALTVAFAINTYLFFVLLMYFILNIAYSVKLKHIGIVDIFIIATGFVLRLFAGNSALDASLSMWIIIMTFLLALFLALAKRRDDVILSLKGREVRKNIAGYNLEFINAAMIFMSSVIIVSYILYTVSGEVTTRFNTSHLYLTSFFVILGIMRYMQITFVEENSGSPTKVVLKDKFIKIDILFWLISFLLIVKGI